jgi:hypothetical protein
MKIINVKLALNLSFVKTPVQLYKKPQAISVRPSFLERALSLRMIGTMLLHCFQSFVKL